MSYIVSNLYKFLFSSLPIGTIFHAYTKLKHLNQRYFLFLFPFQLLVNRVHNITIKIWGLVTKYKTEIKFVHNIEITIAC